MGGVRQVDHVSGRTELMVERLVDSRRLIRFEQSVCAVTGEELDDDLNGHVIGPRDFVSD